MPKFGRPSYARNSSRDSLNSVLSAARAVRRLSRYAPSWGSVRSAARRFYRSYTSSGDASPGMVSAGRARRAARRRRPARARRPTRSFQTPDRYRPKPRKLGPLRSASTYEGNYKGKLPSGSAYRGITKAEKLGYVIEFESGGILSDQEAVYMAHGMPLQVLLESVCGAMARRVLLKWGMSIKSWNQNQLTGSATDLFQWNIAYKATPTGPIVSANSVGALGTTTPLTFAIDLANLLCSQITAALLYFEPVTIRAVWNRSAAADFVEEYRRECKDIDVFLWFNSNLTVQNRTPAATGAADETSALDVANNPVNVKVFKCGSNHISVKSEEAALTEFLNLNIATGFDGLGTATANFPAGLKKVPDWHSFNNTYSQSRSTIGPGNMKDDVLKIVKKMTFSQFIFKMMHYLRTGTSSAATTNGAEVKFPSKMLGFDRRLDTRTSEPPVTIGYELNQKMMVYVRDHQRTVPLRMIAGV